MTTKFFLLNSSILQYCRVDNLKNQIIYRRIGILPVLSYKYEIISNFTTLPMKNLRRKIKKEEAWIQGIFYLRYEPEGTRKLAG